MQISIEYIQYMTEILSSVPIRISHRSSRPLLSIKLPFRPNAAKAQREQRCVLFLCWNAARQNAGHLYEEERSLSCPYFFTILLN